MNHCFVFGAPRSGTTYLNNLLSKIKSVKTRIGETIPIANFHIANQDISNKVYKALSVSIERNIDVYMSRRYHSRFEALEDWWQAPQQIERLYHVLRSGPRPKPNWFIYKEPFMSLAPELTLEAIPDAKIIYIYRDGRDVANSLVDSYDVLTDEELTHLRSTEMRFGRQYDERYVPWWVSPDKDSKFINSSSYVRAIWLWTYMVRRCDQYFAQLTESDQVLQIRYEDLMHYSGDVGKRILNHLDARPTFAFRKHLDRARTTSIGKYKKRNKQEVQKATEVAETMLSQLGYS